VRREPGRGEPTRVRAAAWPCPWRPMWTRRPRGWPAPAAAWARASAGPAIVACAGTPPSLPGGSSPPSSGPSPTTPSAGAKARMAPWHRAARGGTCHVTTCCAKVSGRSGPGGRSPCRWAAPRWHAPARTCRAGHPTHGRRVSARHHTAGRAWQLAIPRPVIQAVAPDRLDDGAPVPMCFPSPARGT
jgi:hypothetical protein